VTLPVGESHDAGTTRWSPEQQQAYAWREVYGQTDVASLVQQHRLRLALEWIDSLALPEEWSALDAGCGAGAMAIEMSRRGSPSTLSRGSTGFCAPLPSNRSRAARMASGP
jgi:2-polyprenyl-3-methyl-5-hydroxy-6-metoxy-1,4-benzoquinol methylase